MVDERQLVFLADMDPSTKLGFLVDLAAYYWPKVRTGNGNSPVNRPVLQVYQEMITQKGGSNKGDCGRKAAKR